MKSYLIKMLFVVLTALVVFISFGCAAKEAKAVEAETQETPAVEETQETAAQETEAAQASEETQEAQALLLSLDELSEYDGKNGNPAYIAVDGIIYDVSVVAAWFGGKHNGYFAGKDVTEEINNISPHGIRVLSNLPEVGKIVE